MEPENEPQENEPLESLTSPSELPLGEGDTPMDTADVKPEKHLKVTYTEGNVAIESVDIAVFDLWGLSRYMQYNPLNCLGDADDEDNVEKYIYIGYDDNGLIHFETNKMSVFDILALGRYLELTGDKMYIGKEIENNARKNMQPQLIRATAGDMNRAQRRHGKEN